MKLHKLKFVLPNLFTVTSIFCGFYALALCGGDASPGQLYQAALAIFFAMFFDGFDGRVARLTRTQTQFGMELDSLADVISFGAAPALLVYKWALAPLGFIGLLGAFLYAACGALRLARFNVLAQRTDHHGPSYFVGLPIPLAAGVIVSVVIAHHLTRGRELGTGARVPYLVVVAVLSLLMVSTVRYRTFKDVRLSVTSLGVFTALCAAGVIIATRLHPAYVLVTYFCAYLALGFVESGLWLGRRLQRSKVQPAPASGVLEDEEDVEEEDYL
ncbi:MAG TPA: CDP-diacylglycerol--serine O-phosphatidyltransferase [Myxococcaceae bacterium]|jgi:CDP-diacylglycerol--serine O-phosphatidyltransferase|nr:CDP-diacylglycerol--serine O-phosphatidyltransferase [Myxococcaceae bacterium]